MNEDKLYTEKQIRRKTFISFGIFSLLAASTIKGWFYLKNLPPDNGLRGAVQEPVRKVLDFNETVFDKALSNDHLAKTYPLEAAVKKPRVNGDIGLDETFNPSTWKLAVTKASGDIVNITLDEIKSLPKTEIIFNFKCIEGWSQVTHWGGVKFSDFAAAFHLNNETAMKYLGMATPDYEYYVGMDMPSALHPQTLLCYEMNGKPLPVNQGYPLRMIIPVKYGVKSIKRIGTLYFDNERPADYWFERGYDYFSGL
ncbi:MAG: molybdopterin-dependent oxidoreductase [Chitinophagaceae bacterium]